MRSTITSSVLLTLLLAGPTPGDTGPSSLEQSIDRYLQPYIDIAHLSGTLLVARDGEVLYEESFGLANHEHVVPNGPRTRFLVASINKPMTTVVLAHLLESGKLALTDKLTKFIPGFPRGDEITIDDLFHHSAGIPDRVTEPIDALSPQTPASMVALAAQRELDFEPGSDSGYSSAGFSVLARVLELAADRPYPDLLAEHVLRPAGMVDTVNAGASDIVEYRASSYIFDTVGLLNSPLADTSYLVGAGSVFSTPRDLLALQRALLSGQLGSRASQMLVNDPGDLSWNGLAHGFRTFADYDASSGVSTILATNLTSGAIDRIRDALPRIAVGTDVPTPAPIEVNAVEVAREVLESYEGAYELGPGRSMELRVVDGRVRMREWLLIPTSETTFFSPQDYAEIEVVLDDNGKAVRLDWSIGGEIYPMPRVATPNG
ncbi:MAG: serine hydrolase [Acidobacteriota bacterium]|nr:serine hydrolase [Acidobacteriota bacterium]